VTTDGLLQMQVRGDCIAPALCHGDTTWIDPNTQPQEGDIVSILLQPASSQYNLNWILKHPEHVATYGTEPSVSVCKILMQLGSTWYGVAAAGSCFELGERTGNRVMGVVRRVARYGTLTYADGRKEKSWVRVFEDASPPTFIPPPEAPALTAHAIAGPPCGPIAARALAPEEAKGVTVEVLESAVAGPVECRAVLPSTTITDVTSITVGPYIVDAVLVCDVTAEYEHQTIIASWGGYFGISETSGSIDATELRAAHWDGTAQSHTWHGSLAGQRRIELAAGDTATIYFCAYGYAGASGERFALSNALLKIDVKSKGT
jgi:hypothetical protein